MRHSGWARALDVQMDTHKWCMAHYGIAYNRGLFASLMANTHPDAGAVHDAEVDRILPMGEALAVELGKLLWQADCMYVTTDMEHLILQAAHDLPEDICFDKHLLITPKGFCLFEEPLQGKDRKGFDMMCHGIAWELTRIRVSDDDPTVEPVDCIMIFFLVDPNDPGDFYNQEYLEIHRKVGIPIPPLTVTHLFPAIDGSKLPSSEIPGSELVISVVKLFVAMMLLAQQKIGEPMTMRPDRATRKRLNRQFKDMPERTISLITLRRKSVKKEGDPQKIEWSRRWPVKGHWRRQWYPKTKTHDWVYIYEYIKGPEDKPLVITERRVFNFRR